MPIAYQEQAQLTCPTCGADFEAPVWLILDAQEQPGAVDELLRDELNLVRCPGCGATGPAGAPLLFHDALARRVIFAPAPGAVEHEWREQARELHAVLVGSIPEEQRRPYLADVDIAQDLAGVAHLLRRAAARRGGPGARGPQAGGAPPASSGAPGLPFASAGRAGAPPPVAAEGDAQAPPLLVAVEALLSANTPAELDEILAAHPVLLEPATDQTLAQLADVAVEQRAYEIADSLREARALLARVGGVATGAPLAPAEAPAEIMVTALPEAALHDLLRAQSAAELEGVAAAHPLLLRPEVDRLLAERVEHAIDDGHERLAHALEERREALVELRAALAGAAPLDEPAPVASFDEAIEALLLAEGEAALSEVIDRYPVLLEDVAAQALWQFAAEARASGDDELARYAVECREMLRRVREGLAD